MPITKTFKRWMDAQEAVRRWHALGSDDPVPETLKCEVREAELAHQQESKGIRSEKRTNALRFWRSAVKADGQGSRPSE